MPTITNEQAGALLLTAIFAIVSGMLNAPVTTVIVALLKRLPFLATISAPVISFAVAIVLTIIVWVAERWGLSSQLQTAFDILVAIGMPLVGLSVTAVGASRTYKAFRAEAVPVLGYSRGDKAA